LAAGAAAGVATIVTTAPDPHAQAEAAELAAALRWALARIPPQAAEAFCLHELEGWSYQEIGSHLSLTSNAVGVLLHRARQKLQKILADALQRHA